MSEENKDVIIDSSNDEFLDEEVEYKEEGLDTNIENENLEEVQENDPEESEYVENDTSEESEKEASSEKKEYLKIVSKPSKLSYVGGEEVSYEGIVVKLGDKDVSKDVEFSMPEGSLWPNSAESKEIVVTYKEDGVEYTDSFELKKKKNNKIFIIIAIVALLAAAGIFLYVQNSTPQHSTEKLGSYILPQGDMSEEEARALLDEQAEKSRITVSVNPEMELTQDNKLRINFIVVEPNNGYSERLEIEQDGSIVYESEIVPPGYKIEWGQAKNGIHVGSATATIYGVGEDDLDTGNPISVEIEIIEDTEER